MGLRMAVELHDIELLRQICELMILKITISFTSLERFQEFNKQVILKLWQITVNPDAIEALWIEPFV